MRDWTVWWPMRFWPVPRETSSSVIALDASLLRLVSLWLWDDRTRWLSRPLTMHQRSRGGLCSILVHLLSAYVWFDSALIEWRFCCFNVLMCISLLFLKSRFVQSFFSEFMYTFTVSSLLLLRVAGELKTYAVLQVLLNPVCAHGDS